MSEQITDLPDWAQKLIRDLRSEAAEHRQAAKDATAERDQLRTKLHERAAAEALEGVRGILADPDDLTKFVEAGELVGEDGAPDPEKYQAAAKSLLESKPHLGKPAGRSGLEAGGARPTPRTSDTDARIEAGKADFIGLVRGS